MQKDREDALTLELLEAIEARSDVTQRQLARRLGVALGLANSYLKRCARKGLIKVHQAPANRYLYYLTPKGFAEKSRLTAEYLAYSFTFYRRAGTSLGKVLLRCRQAGIERVGLYGVSDLAEIAAIRAMEHGVEVLAVCDPDGRRDRFLGIRVVRRPDEEPRAQGWVLTELADPRRAWQRLQGEAGGLPMLVPDILGLKAE